MAIDEIIAIIDEVIMQPESDNKSPNIIENNIKTSKNGFFHQTKLENKGATQTTTVTVTVNPAQENCLSGCFSALISCFKKTP